MEDDNDEDSEDEQVESSINCKTNVKDVVNQKLFNMAFQQVLLEDEFKQYKGIIMVFLLLL